jgi:hypothetical protein
MQSEESEWRTRFGPGGGGSAERGDGEGFSREGVVIGGGALRARLLEEAGPELLGVIFSEADRLVKEVSPGRKAHPAVSRGAGITPSTVRKRGRRAWTIGRITATVQYCRVRLISSSSST